MSGGAGEARYAVIGSPVSHSLSPRIHAAFARQLGHRLTYDAVEVPAGEVARRVDELRATGYRGLNVTIPHKFSAFELGDERTDRCALAGAANTLCLPAEGPVLADNTDGAGLVNDLIANLGVELRGARVLMVGAGGAAQGVVGPLLDAGLAELVIANRTASRAGQLAERAAAYAGRRSCATVRAVSLESLAAGAAGSPAAAGMDVVVNASASSLAGAAPDLHPAVLRPGGACYDMMYGAAARPFVDWGRAAGAGVACDGLGMLVEQAAESFALWRGERPDAAKVLAELRREAQKIGQ